MVRGCSLKSCKNRKNNVKRCFHSFPIKNEELSDKWTAAIRAGEGNDFVPNENTRICSLHFEPSAYSISTTVRRLLPNTVPTIFYPDCNENTSSVETNEITDMSLNDLHDSTMSADFITLENLINEEEIIKSDSLTENVFFDIEDFVPLKEDKATQTDFTSIAENCEFRKKCISLSRTIKQQRKKIEELQSKFTTLVRKNNAKNATLPPLISKNFSVVVKDAEQNELKAISILEQIMNYANAKKNDQKINSKPNNKTSSVHIE